MKTFRHLLRFFLLLALAMNGLGLERVMHAEGAPAAAAHCHHAHAGDTHTGAIGGAQHTKRVGGGCFCGGACTCGCTLQAGVIVDLTLSELPAIPDSVVVRGGPSPARAVLHPLLRPPIV